MTTITIGGKPYETSVFNFKRVKRAWPVIAAASLADDPMDNMDEAIKLVSMALEINHPDATPEFIEENILSTEMGEMKNAVEGILQENDLMPKKGEKAASGKGAGAAPSTETSTLTLPNSLQPAAAEVIG